MRCLKSTSMQYKPITRESVKFKLIYPKTLNCLTKLRLKIQHIVSWVNVFKRSIYHYKSTKYCSKISRFLKIIHVIVTVRCGTSSTRWQSLPSRPVRYTCVTHALLPRWLSLVIAGDRITDYVMCVLQSSITLL